MIRHIRVAVVGGSRTPFVKAGTVFRKYSALDLGMHSVNGLLEMQALDPSTVDGTDKLTAAERQWRNEYTQ